MAAEGIDLALLGYAGGKALTSDRFMMSKNKLKQIYLGVTKGDGSDDEEVPESQLGIVSTKPTKVATRKRKAQPTMESSEGKASDEEAELGMSRLAKRSKPAASSSGSKAVPALVAKRTGVKAGKASVLTVTGPNVSTMSLRIRVVNAVVL